MRDLPGVVQSFGAHMEPPRFWEAWKRRKVYRAKRAWIEHSPGAWLLTTSWLIVRKSDRMLMGEAGFKGPPSEYDAVEIGYGINEAHRGQGIMTEAVGALCDFAFMQKKHKAALITAFTKPANIASHRVLEKNGFARVSAGGGLWKWTKHKEEAP